jgi:FAD/FMN-containing dehydrogenase
VRPALVDRVLADLAGLGIGALGEGGVGTVHVAAPSAAGLDAARTVAHAAGGWLLREAGPLDGFGTDLPNRALMARIKDALDPTGKCNPGRLPLAPVPVGGPA